jgi:hypothetical protein
MSQKKENKTGIVVYIYNPSYSEGGNRMTLSQKQQKIKKRKGW